MLLILNFYETSTALADGSACSYHHFKIGKLPKKKLLACFRVVENTGFEPVSFCLQVKRE